MCTKITNCQKVAKIVITKKIYVRTLIVRYKYFLSNILKFIFYKNFIKNSINLHKILSWLRQWFK